MSAQELPSITKVSKVAKDLPTLRTSIPLDLAKDVGISDGDSLVWVQLTHNGKPGLFARKVE